MGELKVGSKVCSICEKDLPIVNFYSFMKTTAKGEDYVYTNPYCKQCTKDKSRKWSKENRNNVNESKKKYNTSPKGRKSRRKYNEKYVAEGKQLGWQRSNKDKVSEYQQDRFENKSHKISNAEWNSCKDYFGNSCAYCGLHINEHYIVFKGKRRLGDFHREHVGHEGENDLSNCVPSCKSCNSSKSTSDLEFWYSEKSELCNSFSYERLNKIKSWLEDDYLKFIVPAKEIQTK